MADSPDLWQLRYQFALEAQERMAREHRDLVAQLTRALNRVSLACQGQDSALDAELEGLRGFLRMKTLSTDVLASKVDAVDERIRAFERRAHGADPRLKEALAAQLYQLAAAHPPREVARALEALRRELRAGVDALALLERTTVLQAQVLALAPQSSPSREDNTSAPATQAEPGLLRRWMTRLAAPAPVATPAPVPVPAAASEPVQTSADANRLGDRTSKALDALIDTVAAPSAEPALRQIYDAAKARLVRGVRGPELVLSIEEIRVLAGGALARSRDEFERFLQQMNERLGRTATALEQHDARTGARDESAETLQHRVQASMAGIRENVVAAHDLEQLKREVSLRVEEVAQAMDSFREREEQIRAEAGEAAQALSGRISELLEQARHAETRIAEERRLALTDPLTQVPNREAYTQRLAQEYERWRRYGRALSLAVCDIDRFKSVNDKHGHAAGDEVLRNIANCVRGALRDADFVARFGGEEFVILLPETDTAQAVRALDSVRQAIAAHAVEFAPGCVLHVTASFGVAGFSEGDTAERVFTRADAALYQAKLAGRDRVGVYSAAPGDGE